MRISSLNREGNTYHNERLNEFEICMEKLKNLTIKGDTMYTLIAYAFKPGNEDLRDSMLTVLYDKDKKAFLNCFKKTEKSSQKGAESIDFTGVFMIDYEEGREKNVS